jgi:surfactin synthase thioesterase subunit
MRMLDGDHFFAQSAKAELLQAISEESNSLDSSCELE